MQGAGVNPAPSPCIQGVGRGEGLRAFAKAKNLSITFPFRFEQGKHMRKILVALALFSSIVMALPARADDIVVSREEIDAVVKPLLDDNSAQSIVVAIVD